MTEPAGPLRGLRVLDLSWGVAGPVGVLLLAELGADVIKVEPPGGDPFRHQPAYHVWNRSRRSVVLDLKAGEGRDVFLRLCGDADVLVETFSPGTMDRLGLSYGDLSPRCPRLIFCSVPAYPPGHRFADRPGWDATVQARAGMQSEQPGWRAGPIYLHFPAPSMAACFLLATGALSALIHREATGVGSMSRHRSIKVCSRTRRRSGRSTNERQRAFTRRWRRRTARHPSDLSLRMCRR